MSSKSVSCSSLVCACKEIKDLIDNHSHYSLSVFSASVSLRVEVWGKPSLFYGVTYEVYCDIDWVSSGLLPRYWCIKRLSGIWRWIDGNCGDKNRPPTE